MKRPTTMEARGQKGVGMTYLLSDSDLKLLLEIQEGQFGSKTGAVAKELLHQRLQLWRAGWKAKNPKVQACLESLVSEPDLLNDLAEAIDLGKVDQVREAIGKLIEGSVKPSRDRLT